MPARGGSGKEATETGAGCQKGNGFFVSMLLLDFVFCLWIVKSCSGGPPTRLGMHTYTEKSWLPGPSGAALLWRNPGLAGPQAPGGFK